MTRDPALIAALRRTECELSDSAAERLAARITAAAAPRLQALRTRRRAWWEWAAGWRRVAAPIGLAAALAAAVLIARTDVGGSTGQTDSTAVAERTAVLTAATTGSGRDQVVNQFVIPATQDALLGAAMTR